MTESEKPKENENLYEAYKLAYPNASIKDGLDLLDRLFFLMFGCGITEAEFRAGLTNNLNRG